VTDNDAAIQILSVTGGAATAVQQIHGDSTNSQKNYLSE